MIKIAIPVHDGMLNSHFGHCEKFEIIDADETAKTISQTSELEAPPHEPGLLPKFLGERGINLIIAGGMGGRAQALFAERNIKVIYGAPCDTPENLVKSFLDGKLVTGVNACDH